MQPSTPEQFMAEIELFSINEKHGASSAVSRKRNWQRFCWSLQQCTVKSLWWVYDCESTYSCPQLGCINEHHQVWWFYDYWIHAGFQLWSWTFPISSSRLSTSHWWPVMLATDSLKFKERTLKRMTHMTQPLLHHQEWIERTRLRSHKRWGHVSRAYGKRSYPGLCLGAYWNTQQGKCTKFKLRSFVTNPFFWERNTWNKKRQAAHLKPGNSACKRECARDSTTTVSTLSILIKQKEGQVRSNRRTSHSSCPFAERQVGCLRFTA